VQPGVEFGDEFVCDYRRDEAMPLQAIIAERDRLVYEAHSTDYQRRGLLHQMVHDHFAILKVGPALTFAYREALFLLEAIEKEVVSAVNARSDIAATLEQVMLADPQHWRHHYHGLPEAQAFARKYSRSDRSRYYWTHSALVVACERLIANLRARRIPLTLLSQYMPAQYLAVRESGLALEPLALIEFHIRQHYLDNYLFACRP
jgi:D-tagatose-1,6-bisphosphate aldolase subunit GatZ/KbaZ